MKGSNDLNMLLKAKVVKIMVELDITKSLPNIKRQVDEISRRLINKPVKLRVTLDATLTEMNQQLRVLSTRLQTSKSFKPIRIRVEIDVAGSATHIKNQLRDINKVVEDFNSKYGSQVKQMEDYSKRMSQSTKDIGANVPTSGTGVQNFNNIKQYTNQLKEAERIMRSKVPEGEGLFSTHEIKEANGNLMGFTATLDRMNGIVDKTRYSFNQNKGMFEVVDRQTITTTEKEVHRAVQSLQNLQRELHKTGEKSNELQKEYSALLKEGEKGSCT